jgi:hypothetical protein
LNLVDHGIIRILDIAILIKDSDGSVSGVERGEFKQVAAAFAEFEGAYSGPLGSTTWRPPPRWTRGSQPP